MWRQFAPWDALVRVRVATIATVPDWQRTDWLATIAQRRRAWHAGWNLGGTMNNNTSSAGGAPQDVLVPSLLAEAFGGRLLRDDGTSILVDDHGHDHGEPHPPELVPHHGLHQHVHDHGATEEHHDGR